MKGTKHTPDVSVVIRNEKRQILFFKRQHTGYQDNKYCLPSGHVEYGESFSQAAVRETKEEVDLDLQVEDLFPLLSMHRRTTDDDIRIGLVFEARAWAGVPKNMEPHIHDDPVWLDADDLPLDDILQFQADAFRALAAGKQYIESGW